MEIVINEYKNEYENNDVIPQCISELSNNVNDTINNDNINNDNID